MAKGKRKNQPGKRGKTKANETESASAESLRSALISEMKSVLGRLFVLIARNVIYATSESDYSFRIKGNV